MADLPAESRAVYDLLHGELDGLLDRKLDAFADKINRTFADKLDSAVNDLLDEFSFGADGASPSAVAEELEPLH